MDVSLGACARRTRKKNELGAQLVLLDPKGLTRGLFDWYSL